MKIEEVKDLRAGGWRAGGRIVAAWMGALAASAGCTTLPPAERETLCRASAEYAAGHFALAIGRLDPVIRDYDRTEEISEAYYLRGLCRFRGGQVREAAGDFERVIGRRSKRQDLTARARASLAAIEFQAGHDARAAELYAEALPHLPDEPPTDQVLYWAGISMQRVGKWKPAASQFARLLHKFRDRPIAADARRLAGWNHEYYSIQLGAYGNADNAANAVQSFRRRGLDAVQENHPRAGRALWVVLAGRYRTYADAVAALPRVRQVQPDAVIIP